VQDIRDELRERVNALATERAMLQERLFAVEAQERTFKDALREEESRIAKLNGHRAELPFPIADKTAEHPSDVGMQIINLLCAKNRPLDNEEVRDELVRGGLDFQGKKPGRVTHFTLIGLATRGEILRLPDGRYAMPPNEVPVQGKTR
jgi:hypothetical protein